MESKTISFFFLFTMFIFNMRRITAQDQAFPSGTEEEVAESCLGCICSLMTNCNETYGCRDGRFCGLYTISKPYWIDAGRPVINGDPQDGNKGWKRCATDRYCAGQTVSSYMRKFRQDCNSDGEIDCQDFMRIHLLGPNGCSGDLFSGHLEKYNDCIGSLIEIRK